ncbi:MAG: hypothetical protein AB8B62_14925 [Roseobacter sp.]
MDQKCTDRLQKERRISHNDCWREMLFSALSGFYPTDQHLETMFDHLERSQ